MTAMYEEGSVKTHTCETRCNGTVLVKISSGSSFRKISAAQRRSKARNGMMTAATQGKGSKIHLCWNLNVPSSSTTFVL